MKNQAESARTRIVAQDLPDAHCEVDLLAKVVTKVDRGLAHGRPRSSSGCAHSLQRPSRACALEGDTGRKDSLRSNDLIGQKDHRNSA